MTRLYLFCAAALALAAGPAWAHTGVGAASGLAAGFIHPIGGLDHVLAMVAVGVLAAHQGGRTLWLAPLAFVAAMIAGGALGLAGAPIPFVELGIAGSVVLLGVIVAVGGKLPPGLAVALAGLVAVFHGHAHGVEMPISASAILYGLGFAAATALLHAAGIGLAIAVRRLGERAATAALRFGGGATAAAGVALAVA